MHLTSERRKDRRLSLGLDLEFFIGALASSVIDNDRDPGRGLGRTRNVSAGGVYFATSTGSIVRNDMELVIRIAIPQRGEGDNELLALHCEGKVVRIDKLPGPRHNDDQRLGVAVQFRQKPNVEFQSLSSLAD